MWKYIKDMVSVRENGTFILDYMGRIAWIGELIADEGLAYGYLLKSIYSEDTEDILLKIYTLAGKMKTYTCAKAISVDGAKRKGTAILTAIDESASTTKSVKDQLIRYSLDKNENIIAIDTSYVNPDRESDKNTLTLYDSGSMVYENQTGRLGTKTIISSSKTLVILVPEDKSDDPSDYAIGYTFIHREKLNIKAYKINRDNGYADVVVVSGSSNPNISTTASIILVAGITITLDDDDEIIWKFEGYQAGSKVEYTITEDIWNKHEIIRETTPGDIVMIAKNSKGEITGLRRYYDYSTDKGELPTDGVCATTENSSISQWNFLSSGYRGETNWYSSAFGDSPQLSFGYVSKKNADGILEWGYNRDGKTDEAIKVKNIMIYDSEQRKEKDRVYVGTIDDVLDYATVGSNCSTVIVQTRDYAFYNGIVVYK